MDSPFDNSVMEESLRNYESSRMLCPHCGKPLDSAQMRKALNSEIAKRKRPGAKGLVRNPKGRPRLKPSSEATRSPTQQGSAAQTPATRER